jgi:hypothetical protein
MDLLVLLKYKLVTLFNVIRLFLNTRSSMGTLTNTYNHINFGYNSLLKIDLHVKEGYLKTYIYIYIYIYMVKIGLKSCGTFMIVIYDYAL